MSMKYSQLKKIYYSKRSKYEEEYEKRISSESTKKYDIMIKGYPLFVMNTSEITNLVSSIYEKRSKLNDVIKDTPKNALTQYELLVLCDELKASNEIEGINTTRKDLEMTLSYINSKRTIGEGKKNEKRLFGLLNKYVKLINNEEIKLDSPMEVRKLYDELLEEEIKYSDPNNLPDGKIFRKDKVHIMKKGREIVHDGVYPEEEIIKYMEAALEILNDEESPLINISLFHYLFGYIHPFYDGNGRLNRFISSYALSKALDLPLAGIKLSQVIKENRSSYYKSFDETNEMLNRGDATAFVIKFLKTVDKEIDELIEAISDKRDLYKYYEERLQTRISKSKNEELVSLVLLEYTLFSVKGVSLLELAEKTNLNIKTVTKIVKELEASNMIISKKEGRTYYLLDYKKL